MTVRRATFADTESIAKFAQEFKQKKKLFEGSAFKIPDFKLFLVECIRTKNYKVFMSEKDGKTCGFLIMSVNPVPWNKNQKWASDVLFAAERDAALLVKEGIKWAKSLNCWKIFMSNSTGYPQADRFYELLKLNRVGGQFEYVQL